LPSFEKNFSILMESNWQQHYGYENQQQYGYENQQHYGYENQQQYGYENQTNYWRRPSPTNNKINKAPTVQTSILKRPTIDIRRRFSDRPEPVTKPKQPEPFSDEISDLLHQISRKEVIPKHSRKKSSSIECQKDFFAPPSKELKRQHDRSLKAGETGWMRFKGGPTKAESGDVDMIAGSFEMKTLRYNPPSWAGSPWRPYWVSVFREQEEIKRRGFDKDANHMVFGRAPTADVRVPHLSVSRHHFVIQFSRGGGVYLMDLGSTHGTFLMKLDLEAVHRIYHKKRRLEPFSFTKINVCDAILVGRYVRPIVLMAHSNPKLAEDPDHRTCYDWVAGHCGRITGCRFKHCVPKHPHYHPPPVHKDTQESTREHFRNRFYDIVDSRKRPREAES